MKKLASLLLALVMIMSCLSAMAEEINTKTQSVINNTTPHTYDAYQIFSGTQAANGTALGDVVWGTGINGDELLSALQEANDYFDTCTTAADVAAILSNGENDVAEAKVLAALATKHLTETKTAIDANDNTATLATGYYLLVDTTTPGTGDAMNAALLQVTNDTITIAKKYDAPKVDKAVDNVDANIGDTVTFTLTATMPSMLEGYETYKIIFNDTLSTGLTFNGNETVTVTIDGADKLSAFTVNHEAGKLTFSCDDVLVQGAKESSKIVVTYTATVNASAEIGNPGNDNKVSLEYSNNPNWDATGDKEPTGNTPEDTVYVFTYELDVTKADGIEENATKLANAEFVLYREVETTNAETGEVSKATEYVKVDENGKVTGWTQDDKQASTLTSGADGLFKVIGLDTGVYFLKETKAPAGYNLLSDPIKLTIAAEYEHETIEGDNDVTSVTKLTIAVGDDPATDGDEDTGVVNTTVVNQAGATLPETGGMGTTILYVGGGILVLAAIVLLIVKRRANAE